MKLYYSTILRSSRLRWLCAALMSGALSLLCVRLVEARLEQHIDQAALTLSRSVALALDGLPGGNDSVSPSSTKTPHRSRVHKMLVNGINIYAQSAHITADQEGLEQVFARFKSGCQAPLMNPSELDASEGEEPLMATPIMESRGKTESYAYCIRPQGLLTAQGIQETLSRFSSTHDFGALGRFQGMYVRSSGELHQILVMQLVGQLKLEEAFDPGHDVPGEDMGALPRPEGRRRFSISYNDRPVINTYQVDAAPETALAGYRDQLRERGIAVLSPTGPVSSPTRSLVARTANDTFLVLLHPVKETSSAHSRPAALSITRLIQ